MSNGAMLNWFHQFMNVLRLSGPFCPFCRAGRRSISPMSKFITLALPQVVFISLLGCGVGHGVTFDVDLHMV